MIKKIVDQRTVIVQIFGTQKHIKVKIEFIEHGYKFSTRKILEIGQKLLNDNDKISMLCEGLKEFSQNEIMNDFHLSSEMQDFWLEQAIKMNSN